MFKPLMLALLLFLSAAAGAQAVADGAARAPLQYQTVLGAGDVPLNVVTAGDPAKPAILLIHGIGQSHLSFEHQLQSPLTDEFYVVSFDLRGHANSGKPWGQSVQLPRWKPYENGSTPEWPNEGSSAKQQIRCSPR